MNSHERRLLRRVLAQSGTRGVNDLPSAPLLTSASQPRKSNTELPPPESRPGWLTTLVSKSLIVAKRAGGLLLAAATLVGGYTVVRPHLSVDPDIVLTPGDPYSTQLLVQNQNWLFDVTDVNPSCATIHVTTSNDFGIFGLPPRPQPTIPALQSRQQTTMECWPIVGGFGAGPGEITSAYI